MHRSRRHVPPVELAPPGFAYHPPTVFARHCGPCDVGWRGTADSACWCCEPEDEQVPE